jgi:hypothetical protein
MLIDFSLNCQYNRIFRSAICLYSITVLGSQAAYIYSARAARRDFCLFYMAFLLIRAAFHAAFDIFKGRLYAFLPFMKKSLY